MPAVRGLRKLKLSRVDLVPKGSNPGAHIALFKEAPDDAPVDNDNPEVSNMSQTETETPTEAAEVVTAEVETPETETVEETPTAEVVETPEAVEATPEPELAGIEKAEAESIRKELDDAKAVIAKMQADARHQTFVAKAADMALPGDADKWATMLAKLDTALEPAEFTSIETLLKGAAEQDSASALFKQFSSGEADEQTASQRLEKAAAERVTSGASKTKEIAKEYILRTDTDLAAAVAAERG